MAEQDREGIVTQPKARRLTIKEQKVLQKALRNSVKVIHKASVSKVHNI